MAIGPFVPATIVTDPEQIEFQCDSCGARVTAESRQLSARCFFCDAPSVISRPAEKGRPRPVFALGFAIDRETALKKVTQWINKQKMAPIGLKSASDKTISGVYLPAYLYSATAQSQFNASIAEKYEKIRVDSDGGSIGKTEETEYRDLAGRRVAYVSDILVTASRNVTNQELAAIEQFDIGKLRRYSAELISGWCAEEPSLSPEECLRLARVEVEAAMPDALHRFMPGDGVKSLRHSTEFLEESLDLVLAPVWIFAIRYDARKPPLRILVNGQTGKVGGVIPFSWAKLGAIAAAISAAVIVLWLVWSFL